MNSHIGYLIKLINDRIKLKADSDLKSHNLTLAQSRILVFLKNHGGQSTQKEIEDFLDVSHPTVVGIVSRMEKNGFLNCHIDMTDRRNKIVTLTQHAFKIGDNMDVVIREMEAKMLSPLTEEQINQLTKMLDLIYNNLV